MPPHPMPESDAPIHWLELVRSAAAGADAGDLGRGVRRLATLAAAVHRQRAGQHHPSLQGEKAAHRVQGRTPQVRVVPVKEDRR